MSTPQATDGAKNSRQSNIIPPSHTWRTLENSAGYLLPHIAPGMKVLDLGCGFGVMSVDFATHVPEGHVTGIDQNSDVLVKARAYAVERSVTNVDFIVGSILELPFPDATFDITHAHQVLQHVSDPVQTLREMKRVTKPGGIIAARETDFEGSVWYPEIEGMVEWRDLYTRVARARGGEPAAGRRLHVWARHAGLDPARIVCTSGTWCISTTEERAIWSELWSSQLPQAHIQDVAIRHDIATKEGIERLVEVWKQWGAHEDAWFSTLAGEIFYRV